MHGVHRFKMGDFTDTFMREIRQFSKRHDSESGANLEDDAKLGERSGSDEKGGQTRKSSKIDDWPVENASGSNSRRTAKVSSAADA